MSERRPPFRPDVEGLRGAAILLVVLFHAGVAGLAGGFVGVDVFFVLSGYFITGLLAREAAATGGVDLPAFYGRRALRLLPPLLVVLAATLALAMTLYAPIDRADVARAARSAALSSGNVAFAREAVDYFGAGENPLLHTWSLGVEQQFYLAWPLLLLLAAAGWRAGAAPGGKDRSDTKLLVVVAAAGGLSFALSLWLTRASPAWAFFGTAARAWEFALGGALAVWAARRVEGAGANPAVGTVLQGAGLLAIGAAAVTYDQALPYPGTAALLPALGAAVLLAGGELAPAGPVSRALSAGWLRWFGRVSYAWYLWHWPLVALGAVLDPAIGVPGRLAWSALALGLAWLTYRVVEGSARAGRLSRIRAERLPAASFAASVAAALVAHGAVRAAEWQAARPEQRAFAAARTDRKQHTCWAREAEPAAGPCVFGDPRASVTVALLGDSHAEHWLGALDRLGRERGWRVVAMVKGGCPVADVPDLFEARRARHARDCARYRDAMVGRIVALRPAAAIVSNWDHYLPADGSGRGGGWSDARVTPDDWGRGLRRTYARLSAAGVPTVAIRGTPRTGFDVPGCLSRHAAGLPLARECTYARDGSLSPALARAQTAAARGLGVRFVDMNDEVCGAARCPVVQRGVVVFTDDNHLTASFSRMVAPALGARLDAALAGFGVRLPAAPGDYAPRRAFGG